MARERPGRRTQRESTLEHMPHDPLIVFVGPGLTSFEQLAAIAQKRGVSTAWIGYPYSWLRRIRSKAFVARVASAEHAEDLADEIEGMESSRIVDVQASEYVLADAVWAARRAGVAAPVLKDLERRLLLSDKLTMSHWLETNRVRVPAALDANLHEAGEAARVLGLPMVVKGRMGNGGSSVRIVESPGEADDAVRTVSTNGGAMYEQFVDGETVSYSASYSSEGRILHDAVYRTERIGRKRIGPPDRVVTLPGGEVETVGRRIVHAVGGAGLVNVNLIKDASGRLWVHDVNLRPWGTFLALRHAGVDFATDYLHVLGLAGFRPEPSEVAIGRACDVFPDAALAMGQKRALVGLARLLHDVPAYLSWTGFGYVSAEIARASAVALRDRFNGRDSVQATVGSE
jgi:formate-dependent phosphoribosylglycinamide formyltransferase (GAR transformylase)